MGAVLLHFFAIGLASCADPFDTWVSSNSRVYSSREEAAFRATVFAANAARVDTHNAIPGTTFKLGINRFADLLPAEFTSQRTGFRPTLMGVLPPVPAPWVNNWARFSTGEASSARLRGLQGAAPATPTPAPLVCPISQRACGAVCCAT